MGETIRSEVCEKKPAVKITGITEFDEVYIVAGHKGIHAAAIPAQYNLLTKSKS